MMAANVGAPFAGRFRAATISSIKFAALCGLSPIPASSGKMIQYRLRQNGGRHANSALHIIAIGHLRTAPKTKVYVAKRVAEGHFTLDAIRALKPYR
jgi:transposase